MANVSVSSLAASNTPRRPLGLSIVIILLTLANIFGFVSGLLHREETMAAYPAFTPLLWNAYLLCPLIGITARIGIWFWKKWGFWVTCFSAASILAIEFYTMGFG